MGEPIKLYDHMGTLYVTHSPSVAAQALREGLLFMEPPAHTVPEDRQRELDALLPPIKRIDIPLQSIPSPDDTQEVPVVPTGRARRKREASGGVL